MIFFYYTTEFDILQSLIFTGFQIGFHHRFSNTVNDKKVINKFSELFAKADALCYNRSGKEKIQKIDQGVLL